MRRDAGLLGVLLLALLFWRPLQHGATPGEVAAFVGYLGLFVVLPGWLAFRLLAREPGDAAWQLGMGWATGLALHALLLVVLRAFGAAAPHPVSLLLVPLLAWGAWRARRPGDPVPAGLPAGVLGLLALLLVVAAARAYHLAGDAFATGFVPDVFFHAANAAELAHHTELANPRVAGEPLNYHVFSYLVADGAARVAALPAHAVVLRLGASIGPLLLVLQLFNAGRCFSGSVAGGLAAAALVLLHCDWVGEWSHLLGGNLGADPLGSHLDAGVFLSPPTSAGLALYVTLAIVVARRLDGTDAGARPLALLALLSFAASGFKGSILPPVLAGLGATCVLALVRRRELLAPALACLGVTLAASLPVTLRLALGEGSFAGSMFRLDPLAALRGSEAFAALGARFQEAGVPSWLAPAVTPLWLVGFLGLSGIAGVVLALHLRRPAPGAVWLLWTAAAALVFPLLFAAGGSSEIYFLYDAQVALALLGGGLLVRHLVSRTAAGVLLAACVALPAFPMLVHAGRELAASLRVPERAPPLARAYLEGLAWIRRETPTDAVFAARHPASLISVFGERRAFYETQRYTPQFYRLLWIRREGRWERAPRPGFAFPEHVAVRNALLTDPDDAVQARARALTGGAPLYVVEDAVRLESAGGGPLFDEQRFVVSPPGPASPALARHPAVFANEALRIYRVDG